jgi:hypothetical protein
LKKEHLSHHQIDTSRIRLTIKNEALEKLAKVVIQAGEETTSPHIKTKA